MRGRNCRDGPLYALHHRVAGDALQTILEQWRAGMASPPAYDAPVAAARVSYAASVGVDPSCVAVGSQVSVFAGLIAAALPAGSEVLTVAGEFTSIVFPFLAQARRGVLVRQVALEQLAEAVSPRTALVAVSAVQSADGRLADLDALTEACTATGTRVLLDTIQAVGWLPVDARRFAYTTGGGYKWLLAPRGTCFFTVQPELAGELIPHAAGCYAGGERWDSLYGGPLRWPATPAASTCPGLALLGCPGARPGSAHRDRLGRPACPRARPGEPVPCGRWSPARGLGDRERGRRPAHIPSAGAGGRRRRVRAGRLRLAFHVNNTTIDADRAADVVAPHVQRDPRLPTLRLPRLCCSPWWRR